MFHKPRAFLESDKPSATIVIPKSTRNPLFEETSDRAIRAAHRRKWTLVASIGLVIGAAVGAYVYQHRERSSDKSIAMEFLAVDATFADEQRKFQESLQAAGGAADFTKQPDHSASAKAFAEFARKYPAEPLAWQAALRASAVLIEQKQSKEARELLENVVRRTLKNNVAQARLRRTLAGIYADQGEFDKALTELEFAEKLPDNPVLEETKLFRGQVLYLAGKKEDAAKVLREVASGAATAEVPGGGRSPATEASLWLGYWGL